MKKNDDEILLNQAGVTGVYDFNADKDELAQIGISVQDTNKTGIISTKINIETDKYTKTANTVINKELFMEDHEETVELQENSEDTENHSETQEVQTITSDTPIEAPAPPVINIKKDNENDIKRLIPVIPIENSIPNDILKCSRNVLSYPINNDELNVIFAHINHTFAEKTPVALDKEFQIITITNDEEYTKHIHNIMDNRLISIYIPAYDEVSQDIPYMAIATLADDYYFVSTKEIDKKYLQILFEAERPTKIFNDSKKAWRYSHIKNIELSYYEDITIMCKLLTSGNDYVYDIENIILDSLGIQLDSESNIKKAIQIAYLQFALREMYAEFLRKSKVNKTYEKEKSFVPAIAEVENNGLYIDLEAYEDLFKKAEDKHAKLKKELFEKAKATDELIDIVNSHSNNKILSVHPEYLKLLPNDRFAKKLYNYQVSKTFVDNYKSINNYVRDKKIYLTYEQLADYGEIKYNHSSSISTVLKYVAVAGVDNAIITASQNDIETRILANISKSNELLEFAKQVDDVELYYYIAKKLFETPSEKKNITDITANQYFTAKVMLEAILKGNSNKEQIKTYLCANYAITNNMKLIIDEYTDKFITEFKSLYNFIMTVHQFGDLSAIAVNQYGRIVSTNKFSSAIVKMMANEIYKDTWLNIYEDIKKYNNKNPKHKLYLCYISDKTIAIECNSTVANVAENIISRHIVSCAKKHLHRIPITSSVVLEKVLAI